MKEGTGDIFEVGYNLGEHKINSPCWVTLKERAKHEHKQCQQPSGVPVWFCTRNVSYIHHHTFPSCKEGSSPFTA